MPLQAHQALVVWSINSEKLLPSVWRPCLLVQNSMRMAN